MSLNQNRLLLENDQVIKAVCTNDLSSLVELHFSPRSLIYDMDFSFVRKNSFLLEMKDLSLLHISAFFGSLNVFI